jgi:hypothetical protein
MFIVVWSARSSPASRSVRSSGASGPHGRALPNSNPEADRQGFDGQLSSEAATLRSRAWALPESQHVERLIVRYAVNPAAVEDADPLEGEDEEGDLFGADDGTVEFAQVETVNKHPY